MLRVGLTGGVASGKTTVAEQFALLGAPVIDADQITRELMQPDTDITKEILKHFGATVKQADGSLNRRQLRQIIFSNETERRWLEKLLHPAVRHATGEKLKQIDTAYCIVMIPLLIETLPNPFIDRILVVDTPKETQLERLQQRDDLSLAQAEAMLSAQTDRETRLAHADDILVNDGNLVYLKAQVQELHEKYLALFSAHS